VSGRAKKLIEEYLVRDSNWGIEEGLIPKVCSICKNTVSRLVIHHWGGSKLEAIKKRLYRRMCDSCNATLGRIFRGRYPSWSEQYSVLCSEIKRYRRQYPNFDGIEGEWSIITEKEIDRCKVGLREILGLG